MHINTIRCFKTGAKYMVIWQILLFTYSSLYSIFKLEREKSSVPKNNTRHGGFRNMVLPLTVALEKVLNVHFLHSNTLTLLVQTLRSTFIHSVAVTKYNFRMYFLPNNRISTFIMKTKVK